MTNINGTSKTDNPPLPISKPCIIKLIFIFLILFTACDKKQKSSEKNIKGLLKTEEMEFRDKQGRRIILNGLNLVDKSLDGKYLEEYDYDLFKKFKKWGFNCVRLGILWAGVEPKPGQYNEEYLSQVDKWIQAAAEHEVYVILDMHQDLYSMEYADGAPEWATLDENKKHVTGAIWDDAYYLSPAVQTAFDNFWKNKKASDGIGVQDHYIQMWDFLSKRYQNQPYLIGYDLMNEPFNGSQTKIIMQKLFKKLSDIITEDSEKDSIPISQLKSDWLNVNKRLKYYKYFQDIDNYKELLKPIVELNKKFEKDKLQPMYQRIANRIRERDKRRILFLEHSYYSNIGVPTSIEPVKLKSGKTDPQVAYAPHCYDLLTDTKSADKINFNRNKYIFRTVYKSGRRMNIPILLGEWGAFYGTDNQKVVSSARTLINLIEKYKIGNTYWAYDKELEDKTYFKKGLLRPLPIKISGTLQKYDFNYKNSILNCSWKEQSNINAPTIIYLPWLKRDIREKIHLTPKSNAQIIAKNGFGYLKIGKCKDSQVRELKIDFN